MIGFVVWCAIKRCFFIGSLEIPMSILELAFGLKVQYIGGAEMLAAAAVYTSLPGVLDGTFPIHWIDNQGVLSALCKGSSTDDPTATLARQVSRRLLDTRTRSWFEYVASDANISDLPSRGQLAAAARMLRARFACPVWRAKLVLPPLTARTAGS